MLLLLLLAMSVAGAWAAAVPEPVRVLAERIEKLAAREPIESAIDTRLRAAQLLDAVAPELARKFLADGLAQLRAHPEVPRGRTITASVVALDPPEADQLLVAGENRLLAYNQLLWHRASRGQEQRAASLARAALADPGVAKRLDTFWGLNRVLIPLAASHPKEAAELTVAAFRVALTQASPLDLARLLNDLFAAFLTAPPTELDAAFRVLIPVVSDPSFPGKGSTTAGMQRKVNGYDVATRDGHETVLFRLGLFTHVLSPEVYRESREQFAAWDEAIRSVDSRDKLGPFSGRLPAGFGPPVPPYMRALPGDALAAVERLPKREDRIAAYENLALREDFSADQRADAIERARKLIRSEMAELLADPARDSVITHQVARNLRWAGLSPPSDDPALQAKLALIDLEDAVQPAYDFSLPDPSGRTRKLGDERGKVVLINFWATWCPPCRAEMPMLAKLIREWGPKGLSILAISDEPVETVLTYEKQFHYGLSVLLDPARKVFDHYRVQGIPDTRILDQDGRVLASFGELVSEEDIIRVLRTAGLK